MNISDLRYHNVCSVWISKSMEYRVSTDDELDDILDKLSADLECDVVIILDDGDYTINRDINFDHNLTIMGYNGLCSDLSYTNNIPSGNDSRNVQISVSDGRDIRINLGGPDSNHPFDCISGGQIISLYNSETNSISEYTVLDDEVNTGIESTIRIDRNITSDISAGDTLIINPRSSLIFGNNVKIDVRNLTLSDLNLISNRRDPNSLSLSAFTISMSSVFVRGLDVQISGIMRNHRNSVLYSSILTISDISTLYGDNLTVIGSRSSILIFNSRVRISSSVFIGLSTGLDLSESSNMTMTRSTIYNSIVGIRSSMSSIIIIDSSFISTDYPMVVVRSEIIIPDRSKPIVIIGSSVSFTMLVKSSIFIKSQILSRSVQTNIQHDGSITRYDDVNIQSIIGQNNISDLGCSRNLSQQRDDLIKTLVTNTDNICGRTYSIQNIS